MRNKTQTRCLLCLWLLVLFFSFGKLQTNSVPDRWAKKKKHRTPEQNFKAITVAFRPDLARSSCSSSFSLSSLLFSEPRSCRHYGLCLQFSLSPSPCKSKGMMNGPCYTHHLLHPQAKKCVFESTLRHRWPHHDPKDFARTQTCRKPLLHCFLNMSKKHAKVMPKTIPCKVFIVKVSKQIFQSPELSN